MRNVIALVGTGEAADTHINVYNSMKDVEVKWVLSGDIKRAKDFSIIYNVPCYTSYYDDILNDSEIEIVDICNLPNLHISFAERALENKKGVIIEKPIGTDLGKALTFYGKYKRSPFPILIVYQYPYSQTFSKLRELYVSKIYGDLICYRVKYFSYYDDLFYQKWTSDRNKAGGGVLINQGIHFINLIYSFLGYSEMNLFASAGNIVHKVGVEDTIFVNTTHKNGIIGSFCFSTGLPSEMCIELFFEDALVWTKGGEAIVQNERKQVLPTPQKGDFKMLIEDFFLNLKKNPACKMNFKEALQDLNIVMSSYMSAREKKSIKVEIVESG